MISSDTMRTAIRRFNDLVSLHAASEAGETEQPSSLETVLRDYLGFGPESMGVLLAFSESVPDNEDAQQSEAFLAGVVCGAMVMAEAAG